MAFDLRRLLGLDVGQAHPQQHLQVATPAKGYNQQALQVATPARGYNQQQLQVAQPNANSVQDATPDLPQGNAYNPGDTPLQVSAFGSRVQGSIPQLQGSNYQQHPQLGTTQYSLRHLVQHPILEYMVGSMPQPNFPQFKPLNKL